MNKTQKIAMASVTAALLLVSILAYTQPMNVYGKWHTLFPIILGVWAGYGLCVFVTEVSKNKK